MRTTTRRAPGTLSRRHVLAGGLGAALLSAGCSSGSPPSSGGGRLVTHAGGEVTVPTDPERLIVLGEEFLLANVLALGVTPVASTATLGRSGFSGLEDYDLEGIEPLPSTDPNIEFLAVLEPDMILAPEFVVDIVGADVLGALAPTVPLPDGDWRESTRFVGYALGREAEMQDLLDRYDAALAEGRQRLVDSGGGDLEVTLATIYPGPQLAVWLDGPSEIPQTALDLDLSLVPTEEEVSSDPEGRAYLSLEQVPLLRGSHLFMIQSTYVEGEQQAYDEVSTDPLFAVLPSVEQDRVHLLDRLGYPGVVGRIELVEAFVSTLVPPG
jgi:iron complex transport system substrate-binding protein